MSGEGKNVKAELRSGDFGGCLVGGSAEERARGRKIKRRAIVISVVLQTAAMAALLIVPLLAKPAPLSVQSYVPIPPYSHSASQRQARPQRPQPPVPSTTHYFEHLQPVGNIIRQNDTTPQGPIGPEIPIGDTAAPEKSGLLNVIDTRVPPPPDTTAPQTKRVVVGHIDPALLIHRIEPVFPPLARQIRRGGKVELHAIIANDGRIQSLEVVSGDPLFIQSAIDAVRQWRYKPTLLNGRPVEVDTFITVLYTLNQQQ